MKAKTLLMTLLILALTASPAGAGVRVDVYDQQKMVKSVVFAVGVKEYFVDNRIPGVKMDVAPVIRDGRTFVPVRFLANALGVTDKHIGWQSPVAVLSEPGFPTVELRVGSRTVKSAGTARQMDVAPMIRDKRTFLPARFVAEALGYQVAWDAVNQVVIAWPVGQPKPDVAAVISHLAAGKPKTDKVAGVDPVLGRYTVQNGYKIPVKHNLWRTGADGGFVGDGINYAELVVGFSVTGPGDECPHVDENFRMMRAILESKFPKADVDLMLNRFEHKVATRDETVSVKSECLVLGGKDVTVSSRGNNSIVSVRVWGDAR